MSPILPRPRHQRQTKNLQLRAMGKKSVSSRWSRIFSQSSCGSSSRRWVFSGSLASHSFFVSRLSLAALLLVRGPDVEGPIHLAIFLLSDTRRPRNRHLLARSLASAFACDVLVPRLRSPFHPVAKEASLPSCRWSVLESFSSVMLLSFFRIKSCFSQSQSLRVSLRGERGEREKSEGCARVLRETDRRSWSRPLLVRQDPNPEVCKEVKHGLLRF